MKEQAATISQLPVQLLTRILALLEPAERLGSAALVATTWRTAAVQGTRSIKLRVTKMSDEVPKRVDSLSAWLATNSHAGITELLVTMPDPALPLEEMPMLQLPSLHQLPGLECLHCYGVAITPPQANSDSNEARGGAAKTPEAPEAAATGTLLPVELTPATALTTLQLCSCNVTVEGLAALTRLQSLALGTQPERSLSDAVTTNLRTQLQQALPQLQALVSLRLSGQVAHDDALQSVGTLLACEDLPRLQELVLVDGMFTTASFQQLPKSLTHLSIGWAPDDMGGFHTDMTLSASTAPGLCALTALQEFVVSYAPNDARPVSLELLASMTSMKLLGLWDAELGGPGTLSVLTALTRLTSLSLPVLDPDTTMLSDADAAAVTASAQLVELDLSDSWLTADKCQHLFAPGRQLLQLTKLHANIDLIHDGPEASRVAACCPNLASITLAETPLRAWVPMHPADPSNDQFVVDCLTSMLLSWQPPQLQHLTSLTMDLQNLLMPPEVWRALARLTQPRVLKVKLNHLADLAGVLNLTSCTRLKSLCVDARSMEGMMDRVWLDVTGEEAADGTTTLAQQLPKALQQAMLQQVSEDNSSPELLAVLVRCAADVQQAQEQQQGEIAQLRRELRTVQASLAAVLQQLQGQLGSGPGPRSRALNG